MIAEASIPPETCSIELSVFGGRGFDPHLFTRHVAIEPTKIWTFGEPRSGSDSRLRRSSHWEYRRGVRADQDLSEEVLALLRLVDWASLHGTRVWAAVEDAALVISLTETGGGQLVAILDHRVAVALAASHLNLKVYAVCV